MPESTARRALERLSEMGLVVKFRHVGNRKKVLWSAVPQAASTNRLVVSAAELAHNIDDED